MVDMERVMRYSLALKQHVNYKNHHIGIDVKISR